MDCRPTQYARSFGHEPFPTMGWILSTTKSHLSSERYSTTLVCLHMWDHIEQPMSQRTVKWKLTWTRKYGTYWLHCHLRMFVPLVVRRPVMHQLTKISAKLESLWLRSDHFQFGHLPSSSIWLKVDFDHSRPSWIHIAPSYQISTKLGSIWLSYWWFNLFLVRFKGVPMNP